jgi:hypothetical protein
MARTEEATREQQATEPSVRERKFHILVQAYDDKGLARQAVFTELAKASAWTHIHEAVERVTCRLFVIEIDPPAVASLTYSVKINPADAGKKWTYVGTGGKKSFFNFGADEENEKAVASLKARGFPTPTKPKMKRAKKTKRS